MATRPEAPGRPSDFIARLVKDPRNPPEVIEIAGYIGASAEPNRTRIYLDTSLQNYAEVEQDAILHVEPVPEGQLGLSRIFLAATARVYPAEQQPKLDARTAFGGAVYQDYLAGSAGTQGAFPGVATPIPRTIVQAFCPTVPIYTCPTRSPVRCFRTIQIAYCPTWQIRCPTVQVYCPTRHHLICEGLERPIEFENPFAAAQAAQPMAAFAGQAAAPQPLPPTVFNCPITIAPVRCLTVPVIRCPTASPYVCPPRTTTPWHCPTWIAICGYPTWRCPPTLTGCPTLGGCPSLAVHCPSLAHCPSLVCGTIGFDPVVSPEMGMGAAGDFGFGAAAAYDPYQAYSY